MTPNDITAAAKMVAFALGRGHTPGRSSEYKNLISRFAEEDEFAQVVHSIVRGFDLIILDVNQQTGLVLGTTPETEFKASAAQVVPAPDDRPIYLVAQLATAAAAFPRPDDLDDPGYSGRVTVDMIDDRVRAIVSALDQRAIEAGEDTDPPTDQPRLESLWRFYSRRPSTAKNRNDGHSRTTTKSLIARSLKHLRDEGMLRQESTEAGGTFTTTARYQIHVRELASYDMLEELAELGIAALPSHHADSQPSAEPDNTSPQALWTEID